MDKATRIAKIGAVVLRNECVNVSSQKFVEVPPRANSGFLFSQFLQASVREFSERHETLYSKEYVFSSRLRAENSRVLARTFPGRIVMRPPLTPGVSIVSKRGAGNHAQRSIYQLPRGGVQRIVVRKVQQMGHGGQTLFARQHAGLPQAACRSFAHASRRIVGQEFE